MSGAEKVPVTSHGTTRPWLGLALLALPLIVLALDVSVLFLAAPALTQDLDASPGQVLWINDIYGFLIAGFLVPMGALGDRVGRRRLLMIGSLAFVAASMLAAFAPTAEHLIVARALLGLAGATLMPSTMALIRVLFPNEHERQRAIAIWMTAFSASVAAGPVLGGFVIETFWWGGVFLFSVPLLVVFLLAARAILPEHQEHRDTPLDLYSAVLVVLTLLGAAYLVKNVAAGHLGVVTALVLVLAVGAGVTVVRRQFRTPHPLLEPALLRDRRLLAALALLLLSVLALNGFYFLIPQYFQYVDGRSAAITGLLMLPLAIVSVVASLITPMLMRYVRLARLVACFASVSLVGFVVLAFQREPLGALALTGIGCLVMSGVAALGVVMTDLVVGVAPSEHAGAAAGLSETSGELGVGLGVAVLGSIHVFAYRQFVLADASRIDAETRTALSKSLGDVPGFAEGVPDGPTDLITDLAGRAFMAGLSWAAVAGAAAMALCVLLAITVLRSAKPPVDPGA